MLRFFVAFVWFILSMPTGIWADDIETTIQVCDLKIDRTIIQPLKIFNGESLRIKNPSEGIFIDQDKVYGTVLILKYSAGPVGRAKGLKFTEKVHLLRENYRTGLPPYFENSWTTDSKGVWSDVLSIGMDQPWPPDFFREVRQELYCGEVLFAVNRITFTPTDIRFIREEPSADKDIDD